MLAVGDDGRNVTCSSPNSTCYVPDLGCGKSYTFQVTASNAACLSPPSNSFQLETGKYPCELQPSNLKPWVSQSYSTLSLSPAPCTLSSIVVIIQYDGGVLIIIVHWQRAPNGRSRYIATAEDQDHVLISCNSSASSCNLTNVQCGKEYTISVAASTNQCSSLRSPPYKIRTGTTNNIVIPT